MSVRGGSADRLWIWFAVSSVVFLGVLAVSPVKDYFRRYRSYQGTYRRMMLDKASSARELRQAANLSAGIRQIWIPGFDNTVDRCTTCHMGLENERMEGAVQPFRPHPITVHTPADFSRFGCVICHRGQGRATTVAEAHGDVPDWDSPLLPVTYTEASCGRCHLDEEVPAAATLSAGRSLMARAGCYGCHKVPGQETWASQAPDLNGLAVKTSPEWLKAWLKSPAALRPGTLMPDFKLRDEEIDALVAFLWTVPPADQAAPVSQEALPPGDGSRGRILFGQSRCVSCHTIEGRGNGSAPELSGIGSAVTREWLVAFLGDPHSFQPTTRMPRYSFTRQDLLDLSQYMIEELTDPSAPATRSSLRPARKTVDEGERLFRKYGCGGCHGIEGRNPPAPIGPDLAGIGDKPVKQLDFGTREDLPRTLPGWLAAKVSQPRSFREGLKMPEFGFDTPEVQQIVTALLSIPAQPVPPAYRRESTPSSYTPAGRFGMLMRRYRCLSCHRIEGTGGDISTAPLTREGSRVKEGWLKGYLLHPSTIRPALTDRMIPLRMSEADADFIAQYVENVFVDDSIPAEAFGGAVPAGAVERGRQLFFERFGCQACHMVGGRGGYYGPMLDGAGERLRSGWVSWWLRGPQKWRADVRCPDYGMDETDAQDLAAYVVSIPAATGGGGAGP